MAAIRSLSWKPRGVAALLKTAIVGTIPRWSPLSTGFAIAISPRGWVGRAGTDRGRESRAVAAVVQDAGLSRIPLSHTRTAASISVRRAKWQAIPYNEIFQSERKPYRRRGAIMAAKRIGILTGGGDVPGLNSVIKTVGYRGSEIGCEVIGIRRGWEGLSRPRGYCSGHCRPTTGPFPSRTASTSSCRSRLLSVSRIDRKSVV